MVLNFVSYRFIFTFVFLLNLEKAVASTKPNTRRVEINATIDPVKWAVENIFKPDSLLLENNVLQVFYFFITHLGLFSNV